MDRKIVSIAALAVNLMVVPAMAADPTLPECQKSFIEWVFGDPGIVSGVLRTRSDLAIALNESVLEQLDDAEAEHIRKCVDVLTGDTETDVPADPGDWPYNPGEET